MTKVIFYEQEDLDLYHQYVKRRADIILNHDVEVWTQDKSIQQEIERIHSFLTYFFDKYLHETQYHDERSDFVGDKDDVLLTKVYEKTAYKLQNELEKKKASEHTN